MTQARSRRWLSLATVLIAMSALLLPLSTAALATNDNELDLNVEPEEGAAIATGDNHSITFRITTQGGCPDAGGCNIDAEIENLDNTPKNPDFSCTIAQTQAACSSSYSSNARDLDVIRVWVDDDQQDTSPMLTRPKDYQRQKPRGTGRKQTTPT